jgi:hypothetical protein
MSDFMMHGAAAFFEDKTWVGDHGTLVFDAAPPDVL